MDHSDFEQQATEPLTPEQQAAERVEAIAALDMLIARGGADLLIASYCAQKAWLQSIDLPELADSVDDLKAAYMKAHLALAASLR
jgi:hypothetical protein